MSKFLIFVEDPGVTNMILEFPSFFQYLNADFQIIAVNYAKEILQKKIFLSLVLKTSKY